MTERGREDQVRPTKDDALEAMDFIINVLKDHENNLERLVTELGNITDNLGSVGELTDKIEKVQSRLDDLHEQLRSLTETIGNGIKTREEPDFSTRIRKLTRDVNEIRTSILGLAQKEAS